MLDALLFEIIQPIPLKLWPFPPYEQLLLHHSGAAMATLLFDAVKRGTCTTFNTPPPYASVTRRNTRAASFHFVPPCPCKAWTFFVAFISVSTQTISGLHRWVAVRCPLAAPQRMSTAGPPPRENPKHSGP